MARRFNITAAVLVLILCCVALRNVNSQKPGGLNDELPADDEVRKVLDNMKDEVEQRTAASYSSLEPVSYRRQVVAGLNYFIKARAVDKNGAESHVHVRVFKPFRGPLQLTAVRANLDQTKPLEYFD